MSYTNERRNQKTFGKPKEEKKKPTIKRTPVKKKFYRINPVSEKRKKKNEEYKLISEKVRADNPECQIKSPDCMFFTHGAHHVEGRVGADLTDPEKMIGACNPCNLYVETHPEWAKKNGFKKANYKSKLSSIKK